MMWFLSPDPALSHFQTCLFDFPDGSIWQFFCSIRFCDCNGFLLFTFNSVSYLRVGGIFLFVGAFSLDDLNSERFVLLQLCCCLGVIHAQNENWQVKVGNAPVHQIPPYLFKCAYSA